MTRRRQDISRPHGETSTNAAIGAGLAMLAAVIAMIILGIVIALLFSVQNVRI